MLYILSYMYHLIKYRIIKNYAIQINNQILLFSELNIFYQEFTRKLFISK